MDVRIGVIHTAKELDLELPDDADRDALKAAIDKVLADDDGVLWLTDRGPRGRRRRREGRLRRDRREPTRAPRSASACLSPS